MYVVVVMEEEDCGGTVLELTLDSFTAMHHRAWSKHRQVDRGAFSTHNTQVVRRRAGGVGLEYRLGTDLTQAPNQARCNMT